MNTDFRKKMLFSVLLAVFSGQVAAEDDLYFSEMPLIASVSRLPQKLSETPGAVTVIDRETIRASGFRTVEDLMRLVPGFQVTQHNQDPAVVTYHGLNAGMNSEEYGPRLQVQIDGRSQYSPLFKSGVNWNLLPVALENIERIEVVRGTNTVAYGSNAFLGVVNIVTQDATQTKGWLVSSNYGNNMIRDETVRWGGKVGEADVRLTYHRLGDEGFQHALYTVWGDPNDSRQSRLFDLRADLPLNDRDELQLTLSRAEDVSQYGRPDRPTSDPFRDLTQSSTSFSAQWRRIISTEQEVKLRYSHTEDLAKAPYLRQYKFVDVATGVDTPTFTMAMDPGGKSLVDELEFEHINRPLENTRLMLGGAAKSIRLNSPGQFSTTDWQKRTNYRVFGNLEYRPDAPWLFNVGASLEKDSLNGVLFDPRVSASYHLAPEHTLRFVVSRAHRTPSLYEMQGRVEMKAPGTTSPIDLTYLGQGVKPEQIDSIELGYLGQLREARASFDFRGFVERIPNMIQIVPLALPANNPDDAESVASRTYVNLNSPFLYGRADGAVNLQRVLIKGYESQLKWQPFDKTRLYYNYALIKIDADITDVSLVADIQGGAEVFGNTGKIYEQTRQSAPRRSQSLMLMQELPWNMQASVMYFQSGSMRWRRNGTDPLSPTERFDWRLAKKFKIGDSRAELAYTVQMQNGSQEGRIIGTGTAYRYIDKLHWLSLRLDF